MGSGIESQSESSSGSHSVTQYLSALRRGDPEAAHVIFQRYFHQLMTLARRKLGAAPRKRADEEDVVIVAMTQFFEQVQDPDRFPRLDDRDDLWQVLAMMVDRRAKDQLKVDFAQKRQGGNQTESIFFKGADNSLRVGIDGMEGPEPTPELAEYWLASLEEMLTEYDEREQQAILLKVEGYTHEEIADRLGTSKRTLQRLYKDIREKWGGEEDDA